MLNQDLKVAVVSRVLPRVRTPAQYVGGELNSIVKDHRTARGIVCLAFPDTYALGMSHHGLQVLYTLMNERDWACERVFTPLPDFETALRERNLPLYSLETFTPLNEFDVIGFSLQYEICYTNVLTMLDLGRIPLKAEERGPDEQTAEIPVLREGPTMATVASPPTGLEAAEAAETGAVPPEIEELAQTTSIGQLKEMLSSVSKPEGGLSDDDIDRLASRVVERLSERIVREIAWEVIPDVAEIVIKQRIKELEAGVE